MAGAVADVGAGDPVALGTRGPRSGDAYFPDEPAAYASAFSVLSRSLLDISKNLLRDPFAALGGVLFLAYLYLLDKFRLLRTNRLALGPLVTVFDAPFCCGDHCSCLGLQGFSDSAKQD